MPVRRLPAAWMLLLVAIPPLVAIYLLLPTDGLARTVAYPVFGIIGAAAILVGVRRRRPRRAGSWRLLALAFVLVSVGDVTQTMLGVGGDVPYPSWSDAAYLAAYVALIGGVLALMSGRTPGGDRTSLIDAAILSVAAAAISWVTIIQPIQGPVNPLVVGTSHAYPLVDLVLLALGLRVILGAGERRPHFLHFLVAGIGFYFVADVVYAMELINGTYVEGHPVDAVWIVGLLLVGVAALHPSVAERTAKVGDGDSRLSRPRLFLLGAAAMIAPTILVVKELADGHQVAVGLVVLWAVLFGLVFIRFAITLGELALSLSERRQLQGDLAYQAHHDPLTKLANRLLFNVRLARAVAAEPQTTAVIFLDLDDFKAINDTFGHPTGDQVLGILGGRLQRGLRGTDLAARIGGDEFAILVEDCQVPASALAVAERAMNMLRAPITLGGRQVVLHASAGVAIGHAGSTETDLMRDADIAMYQAKSHGKDQVELYDESMQREVRRAYEAILHPEPSPPTSRRASVKAKLKVPRAA
ncbi:MAG: diguanylate cyclase domain-containing protein [Candidatus Limnocylindria bacterium]